jgi:hypothetical protein
MNLGSLKVGGDDLHQNFPYRTVIVNDIKTESHTLIILSAILVQVFSAGN